MTPSGERMKAASRPPLPWGAFSGFAALGIFWGGWGALLPAVKAQTGATNTQLGAALLLVAVGALPAMLASGRFIDRFGHRILAPTAAAFGVAILLPGLTHSGLALAWALLLVGAASGALDVTANAMVAEEEARLGTRLMHAAHAIFSGSVVISSVSVGLARSVGARPPLVLGVIAGVVLLGAAVAHLAVRSAPAAMESVARDPQGSGGRFNVAIPLLVLGGLCALAYLVEDAVQSWSALHLEESLGAGPAVGGLGPGVFAGAATIGRLGAQRLARSVPDRLLLMASGTVAAAGTVVTAFAPSPAVALAGVLAAGAGISVTAPTIFSLTGRAVAPGRRGTAMATVTTIAYLGFLLGPPMVGAIAGALDLRLALAAVAGVAALFAALSRFAPRPS